MPRASKWRLRACGGIGIIESEIHGHQTEKLKKVSRMLYLWVAELRRYFVLSKHSLGWLELMNCFQTSSNILFLGSGLTLEKTLEIHF